jgi:hypothetical protein
MRVAQIRKLLDRSSLAREKTRSKKSFQVQGTSASLRI